MFKDADSTEFMASLFVEVEDEVSRNRLAVHAAVGAVQAAHQKARIAELFSVGITSGLSESLASSGAGTQWAQESSEVVEFGKRLQKSRDQALAEINHEQYRKRAAAYARNKASGQY